MSRAPIPPKPGGPTQTPKPAAKPPQPSTAPGAKPATPSTGPATPQKPGK